MKISPGQIRTLMRALKDAPAVTATVITVDPTELKPGDLVMNLGDHDISGCHCDVRVTVLRNEKEAPDA